MVRICDTRIRREILSSSLRSSLSLHNTRRREWDLSYLCFSQYLNNGVTTIWRATDRTPRVAYAIQGRMDTLSRKTRCSILMHIIFSPFISWGFNFHIEMQVKRLVVVRNRDHLIAPRAWLE